MQQAIIDFLQQFNIPSQLMIFIISTLPILELRGGLIAASILQVDILEAFLICYIGNMFPIPFILLFIKAIFRYLKKFKTFRPIILWLEKKGQGKKSASIRHKKYLGLFLLIAIPLPGTGGWSGALIASLLNMPIKKTFMTIAAGVFIAGLIMLVIAYFLPGMLSF